jgi:WD40 repeat protein
MVSGCQFLPEGNTLLSWSYDGTIRLWELARASEVGAWGGHEDRITSGAVSPDGKWFATASRDGVVLLWDARNLQEAGRYVDHRAEICGCFFSTDARLLITVSALGEVVTHAIPEFQTHSGQESGVAVRSASLSHDGERLVLGGEDGKLSFFKVEAATQRSSCATAVLSHEPRRKKGLLGSLFRVEELQPVLRCVCPVCRTSFEVGSQPGAQAKCPGCCRDLRLNPFTRPAV